MTVEVGRWDERDPRRGSAPITPLKGLETLAWLLDSSIPVPGLRFRIGIDSLIGLIPAIGDAIGALFSTYILVMAASMGVPRVTLLRMAGNIALDSLIGIVPVFGDLFDFAWKANLRNVALLRAHQEDPRRARRGDWLFALSLVLAVAAALGLLGWAGFALGKAVF